MAEQIDNRITLLHFSTPFRKLVEVISTSENLSAMPLEQCAVGAVPISRAFLNGLLHMSFVEIRRAKPLDGRNPFEPRAVKRVKNKYPRLSRGRHVFKDRPKRSVRSTNSRLRKLTLK